MTYDQDTGVFTLLDNPHVAKKLVGKALGRIGRGGYVNIQVMKRNYYAHRLAWIYVYGYSPKNQIDHINGVKNDNRIDNLREATASQNTFNRRLRVPPSGVRGVFKDRYGFKAYIKIENRQIFLGRFNSLEEAATVRKHKEIELYGQFAGAT